MKLTKDRVLALRSGDVKAFEEIVRLFYRQILFFVNEYVKNEEDAREITQDAFTKLWEKRENLDADANLRAYLFTIAKNMALMSLRGKRRIMETSGRIGLDDISELHAVAAYDPASMYSFSETRSKITEAVEAMPEQRKRVFLLSREKGMSYAEISEELNISLKTVEAHVSAALKSVRKSLNEVGITASGAIISIIITLLIGVILR
ncbi:DNA-directed RNA polymerase sigma-70 factor [Fulvitalea axinellae]|uniref:DNA-directed RNA polymerase sigma-70 factor n=1 Tax=Fulvitalea axinellae TaxID=1182444 RepID=A0AAU9CRF6_9BACT|nr:DNA-directed RNA polymerase sigma-70 factor [Fulvitalea axinellae]